MDTSNTNKHEVTIPINKAEIVQRIDATNTHKDINPDQIVLMTPEDPVMPQAGKGEPINLQEMGIGDPVP